MSQPSRYHLEVNLTIVKEIWVGPVKPDGSPVDDHISYWTNSHANERLAVNESVQLGSLDFMELMGVLVHLHDAVSSVKKMRTDE